MKFRGHIGYSIDVTVTPFAGVWVEIGRLWLFLT